MIYDALYNASLHAAAFAIIGAVIIAITYGYSFVKKKIKKPSGMNERNLWKVDTKDQSNKKEEIKNPVNRKSKLKGNETTDQFSEPGQRAVFYEERIYADIADEIDSGSIDKGLWTRLFVECDGDEKRTKFLYIKQRSKRLIQAEKLRMMEKNQDSYVDDQVQPKMHKVIQRKKAENNSKLSDSDDSNRKVKNALPKSGVHHWGVNYESQDLQQRCPECGDFFHGIGFTTCDRCGCQLVPE